MSAARDMHDDINPPEADDEDPEETSADGKKKGWVGRETWVRGLDHVLPIDHEMGDWWGPVEKLVELLEQFVLVINGASGQS